MADLDLARIKRNVAKMAAQNAPEADIDGYIASEGTTVDAIRAFRLAPQADAEGQKFGGVGMNATAGANEVLYDALGAPVDLMRGAMNFGVKGVNAVAGTEIPTIPDNSFGGSKSIAQGLGAIRPELDPANTIADTTPERIARGVGQGAAGTILPAAAVGAAARAGAQVSPLVQAVAGRSNSVRAAGADAVAGAAAGGGAAAAMEVTPDKYDPIAGMAGGIVGGGLGAVATGIPGLAAQGVRGVRDYVAPMTAGGRERLAGETIRDAATDAPSLHRALAERSPEMVPGSRPTTFQQTGDMGVGALERDMQTKFPGEFQERRADQNIARVGALEGIQPKGAPEAVTKVLRDRLKQIDDETQADLDLLTRGAQGRSQMVGQGQRPEDAGETIRTTLQRRRDVAMEKESRLWGAVDPDGSLALSAPNATALARGIDKTIEASAKPPSGEEAAVYDVLHQYGEVVPFRELTALRSRVSTAIADERGRSGKSPTWARMVQIRGAIEKDIDLAVTTKVARETEAVAAGTMREEDTVAANFQRQAEEWFAEREARASAGDVGSVGVGAGRRAGSTAAVGVSGAAGQTGGRPSGPPRDPRLSPDGLDPNFDRAAQERLNTATEATRDRAGTFDNRTLGPVLARPADHAPYNMEDARVAARVFVPGAGGFERMQTFRQAGGTKKAMAAVEGYAIDRLRKTAMNEDGTLEPSKVDQWRRAHDDALRAFPELDLRLQDASRATVSMQEAAAARKAALEDAQKGVVGQILKVDNPQDVTRTIGQIFGRRDSAVLLDSLKRRMGGDKEGQEGLRKAAADFVLSRMIGNTEIATSGQGGIRADSFQMFVRQNEAGLRSVFSAEEVETFKAVAADIQRSSRSLNAVRVPGQSNTAQDQQSILQRMATMGMENWTVAVGGTAGAAVGGVAGAGAGSGTAALVNALRLNGIGKVDELVRDALLDPRRARMLLAKLPANDQRREEAMLRSLARRYVKAATASTMVGEQEPPKGPMRLPERTPPMPGPQAGSLAEALATR